MAPPHRPAPSWLTVGPIAHRGLHDPDKPENSLAAIMAAVTAGYGIELDVNISKDGNAVVFHDADLNRLCGEDYQVKDLTLNELQAKRLGQTTETIPSLSKILSAIDGKVPVLVELKGAGLAPHKLEKAVLELLSHYQGPASVLCFNPFVLKWFHEQAPHIIRGLNAEKYDPKSKFPEDVGLDLERLIDRYDALPDYFSYNCRHLPNPFAAERRQEGYPLLTWTTRTRDDYDRAMPYADAIMFEGFIP